jgi:hypothetical protein
MFWGINGDTVCKIVKSAFRGTPSDGDKGAFSLALGRLQAKTKTKSCQYCSKKTFFIIIPPFLINGLPVLIVISKLTICIVLTKKH